MASEKARASLVVSFMGVRISRPVLGQQFRDIPDTIRDASPHFSREVCFSQERGLAGPGGSAKR
jgi:hypothetical protein